ncbi:MAG: antiterminator LoaP [Treponema sp.]|nr:antiterminator LoaP [Treponema sp.]
MNYYAVQVTPRQELKFIEQAQQKLANRPHSQHFIFLRRQLTIWRAGKKLSELQPLFPGYVFIEIDSKIDDQLYHILKTNKYFYRFLNSNHDIVELNKNDLSILHHFLTLGETVRSSLVYFDEHDKIVVTEGPLKGLEGKIIKVDKRKHRAKVQVEFTNTQMTFDLSFETIAKDPNEEEDIKHE